MYSFKTHALCNRDWSNRVKSKKALKLFKAFIEKEREIESVRKCVKFKNVFCIELKAANKKNVRKF